MKRIVIAVAVVVLAVFISIYGYFDLKKMCGGIIESLEGAVTASAQQDYSAAESSLQEALNKWQSSQLKFGIYCNHDSLDELDLNFRELEDYTNKKTDCDIESVCLENIRNLEKIVDSEAPKLKNVF